MLPTAWLLTMQTIAGLYCTCAAAVHMAKKYMIARPKVFSSGSEAMAYATELYNSSTEVGPARSSGPEEQQLARVLIEEQ